MNYQWPILLYGTMCLSDLLFFGSQHRSRLLRIVSRIAPQFVIIGCCMHAHGQSVGKANIPPFLLPRIHKMLWGSLFFILANVYLHFHTLYLYNRFCVVIALGFFIILFSDESLVFSRLNTSQYASGALVFAAVFIVCCYVLRKSSFFHGVLLVINSSLMSLMLWSAVLQVQKFYVYSPLTTVMGAFGAASLVLSEVISIVDRYRWMQRESYVQSISTSCFYLSQILTAFHIILSKD